jgi:hypothetical protein
MYSAVLYASGISLSGCTFSTESELRLSIGELTDAAGGLLMSVWMGLFGCESGCLRTLLNANLELEDVVGDCCIFFKEASRPDII